MTSQYDEPTIIEHATKGQGYAIPKRPVQSVTFTLKTTKEITLSVGDRFKLAYEDGKVIYTVEGITADEVTYSYGTKQGGTCYQTSSHNMIGYVMQCGHWLPVRRKASK